MAKFLTLDEWYNQTPPIYWLDTEVLYPNWDEFHIQVAIKWAVANGESWVYRSGKKIVFGNETDRFVFQMWAQDTFDPAAGSI